MCAACTYSTRHIFISLAYMHVCACKTDDVEALVQRTCVCSRHVHDNLHKPVHVIYAYTKPGLHAH